MPLGDGQNLRGVWWLSKLAEKDVGACFAMKKTSLLHHKPTGLPLRNCVRTGAHGPLGMCLVGNLRGSLISPSKRIRLLFSAMMMRAMKNLQNSLHNAPFLSSGLDVCFMIPALFMNRIFNTKSDVYRTHRLPKYKMEIYKYADIPISRTATYKLRHTGNTWVLLWIWKTLATYWQHMPLSSFELHCQSFNNYQKLLDSKDLATRIGVLGSEADSQSGGSSRGGGEVQLLEKPDPSQFFTEIFILLRRQQVHRYTKTSNNNKGYISLQKLIEYMKVSDYLFRAIRQWVTNLNLVEMPLKKKLSGHLWGGRFHRSGTAIKKAFPLVPADHA